MEEKFELLKTRIVQLKSFTVQLTNNQKQLSLDHEESELQKIMEQEGFFVKHLPMNGNRLFRVFSDTLYFTPSRYKEIKYALSTFVQKHDRQVSKLLSAFYSGECEIENYISQLMMGSCDFEITLVLL
jgi:hypothetical protein